VTSTVWPSPARLLIFRPDTQKSRIMRDMVTALIAAWIAKADRNPA